MREMWEYESERLLFEDLDEHLNEKGKEGWELVTTFWWDSRDDGTAVAVTMRRKLYNEDRR